MKQVEFWRWVYRDGATGKVVRTEWQMTAEDAAKYPGAARIPGSMKLRSVEDDFSDFQDTSGCYRDSAFGSVFLPPAGHADR